MNSYEQMRSALITARSALTDLSYSGEVDVETYKAEIEVIDKALALPRRNCDVGTVEDQVKRFKKRCHTQSCNRVMCGSNAKVFYLEECAIRWAQMPYEEVKE